MLPDLGRSSHPMLQVAIGDDDDHLLRVGFGAGTLVVTLGLLYVAARIVDMAFTWCKYTATIYLGLDISKQRNVVTYVLEIIITTVQLPWVMMLLWKLWYQNSFQLDEYLRDYGELNAMVLSGLFVFELLYRVETPWQLLVHHIAAVLLVLAALIRGEEHGTPVGSDTVIWVIALIVTLTALTEQPVFLALLFYRFDYMPVLTSWMFKLSAIQNFLCKVGLNIAATTLWAQATFKQDPQPGGSYLARKPMWSDDEQRGWWLILWPALGVCALLPAQLIAVSVQWSLGNHTTRRKSQRTLTGLSNVSTKSDTSSGGLPMRCDSCHDLLGAHNHSQVRLLHNNYNNNYNNYNTTITTITNGSNGHHFKTHNGFNSSSVPQQTQTGSTNGVFQSQENQKFYPQDHQKEMAHDHYVHLPDFHFNRTEVGSEATDGESSERPPSFYTEYLQGIAQSFAAMRDISCRSAVTDSRDSSRSRSTGMNGGDVSSQSSAPQMSPEEAPKPDEGLYAPLMDFAHPQAQTV
eukprot:gb/GEZN01003153.1/.p1 GENE.gb/GEZN01003153.1/~~gb/GEZN01003153.1/.p1  ORF type:complete len:519 (+),score=44.68 gb/GEZN01003153.1/:378-1934(+)